MRFKTGDRVRVKRHGTRGTVLAVDPYEDDFPWNLVRVRIPRPGEANVDLYFEDRDLELELDGIERALERVG